ncbi:hypothetical protein SAICODRAFT_5658 [Saitoella complicata NRRL Y-17804]|uniref:Uncharacterized protein n=1 Tax=Saitoella complicata (strain BCRC 22490 / CBS 7301 / JCM 7358 / NBRC 10748 / NRRL Y-17804) TaxID=698492 RepID=A0A0E9NQW6_SAICN|nr:uncharacterized protein SAICODRAFT_5658 [Saitoella complicata NRRL Y-17804]ODQ55043.1 hypothetical protein SAICODRAFT_5658 [Saitoella complicata NRRL Y-17804]GAO52056.1 hypothetical protein G7K_6143-t1 [Saitoella complicata NRRL Y-17804]
MPPRPANTIVKSTDKQPALFPFQVALAVTLLRSKPPGVPIKDYIQSLKEGLIVTGPLPEEKEQQHHLDAANFWKRKYEAAEEESMRNKADLVIAKQDLDNTRRRLKQLASSSSAGAGGDDDYEFTNPSTNPLPTSKKRKTKPAATTVNLLSHYTPPTLPSTLFPSATSSTSTLLTSLRVLHTPGLPVGMYAESVSHALKIISTSLKAHVSFPNINKQPHLMSNLTTMACAIASKASADCALVIVDLVSVCLDLLFVNARNILNALYKSPTKETLGVDDLRIDLARLALTLLRAYKHKPGTHDEICTHILTLFPTPRTAREDKRTRREVEWYLVWVMKGLTVREDTRRRIEEVVVWRDGYGGRGRRGGWVGEGVVWGVGVGI